MTGRNSFIMIAVNVKQLISAIKEADVFQLPAMSEGTQYLYSSVYCKLTNDMEVMLSNLDFDAFEPEDVDALNALHSDVFERNRYTVSHIASTLRSLSPACKNVAYI